MDFGKRIATFRKERGLNQIQLAARSRIHVGQIRRYEGGTDLPTLEVFRRLVTALAVSSDALLFGKGERGPDDAFHFRLEALRAMSSEDRQVAGTMLDALIFRHGATSGPAAGATRIDPAALDGKDENGEEINRDSRRGGQTRVGE